MNFNKPYTEEWKDGRLYHVYHDKHTAEAYSHDYLVAGWRYHDNQCAFSLAIRVYPFAMSSGWALGVSQ